MSHGGHYATHTCNSRRGLVCVCVCAWVFVAWHNSHCSLFTKCKKLCNNSNNNNRRNKHVAKHQQATEEQQSSSRRRCWSAPGSDSISVCNNFSTVLHISLSTSCYNVFPVCAQRSKSGYERSYLAIPPPLTPSLSFLPPLRIPFGNVLRLRCFTFPRWEVFLLYFLWLFEEVAPLATLTHIQTHTHTCRQRDKVA